MKVDPLDIMNKFAEWTLSTGPCPINLSASSGQHHHWAKKVAALCDEIAALETKIARMRPVFNAAIGVCVTGKATLPQLIKACRAARKAKGK